MKTTWMLGLVLFAACADSSNAGDELWANDDTIDVEVNTPVERDLLANDLGFDASTTVSIVAQPTSGMATLEGGVLHYTPAPDYLGDDELRYVITNADGTTHEANVYVHVNCETCAVGKPITLEWTANAPEEMVLGYRIYFGVTEDAASMTMVDDIGVSDAGFDNTAPTRVFDGWSDFKLRYGETACFRLTAYNSYGESDFTNAVCVTLVKEMAAQLSL